VPERNDEIRDLVVSINRMTGMLARYEEEVRRSERLRTLGQLGGGIAHQIRNAVTGCRMALDLHARECAANGDESLTVATRQLQLIERYVQRFLALGRGPQTRKESVELTTLLQNVLQLVTPAAKHVGVEISLELPRAPVELQTDSQAIEQALVNLLLNAIEAASGPGTTQRNVIVRLASEADAVCIDVVDQGPGVSEQVRPRLFEPFATDKPDGVGLGLTTARDLIRTQGGEIELRDSAAETCFRVRLPQKE